MCKCRLQEGHADRAMMTAATSATLLVRGTPRRDAELWMKVSVVQAAPAAQDSSPLLIAEPSVHMLTSCIGEGRGGGTGRGRVCVRSIPMVELAMTIISLFEP